MSALEFACANVDGQETLCRVGDLKTAVENGQESLEGQEL